MTNPSTKKIAHLRAINVGGNRKVPMAELAALAQGLGLRDVTTYIQSGNLLCSSPLSPEDVAKALEPALLARFGFAINVVVRDAAAWAGYAAGSPFPEAARERPQHLHLVLPRRPPAPGAEALLRERVAPGEQVALRGDALWVDFAAGAGRTKLTPALIDRALGSPATARNWKTVQKLAELAGVAP